MSPTDLRETLHEVAASTTVPARDEVAFRAAVRRERRRRAGRRTVAVTAVAAAVAAVAVVVPTGVLPGGGDHARVATGPSVAALPLLTSPVYLVRSGRLVALAPDGKLRDLGLDSEGVVGATTDGVLALDRESHLVAFTADRTGAGWSYRRATPPFAGPVSDVATSGDGAWTAWADVTGHLGTSHDGTTTTEPLTGADPGVVDVSARAVLLREGRRLSLRPRAGGAAVDVPVAGDGYGVASTTAGSLVAVPDRDGKTRVYDVRDATARLVSTVAGRGVLSPDGTTLATVRTDRSDDTEVWVWRDGTQRRLTGLEGRAQDVSWTRDGILLVSSAVDRAEGLWACDVAEGACGRLPLSGRDLSLG